MSSSQENPKRRYQSLKNLSPEEKWERMREQQKLWRTQNRDKLKEYQKKYNEKKERLTETIKTQQTRIDKLEKEVAQLKAKNRKRRRVSFDLGSATDTANVNVSVPAAVEHELDEKHTENSSGHKKIKIGEGELDEKLSGDHDELDKKHSRPVNEFNESNEQDEKHVAPSSQSTSTTHKQDAKGMALTMLKSEHSTQDVAQRLGLAVPTVRAWKAWMTMGKY